MGSAINKTASELGAHAIRRSERGTEAFDRAARHSRRVRRLKILLPVAASFIAVAFLGYSLLPSTGAGGIDLRMLSIEGGKLVMENPTLGGFTDENLPYTMTAERARQAIGGQGDAIQLEGIRATVPIDRQDQATISAEGGIYDRQNNRLALDGAITLRTTSGILARLQSAEVDMASNVLSTEKPVEIEMSGMQIRADSFRAADGGKTLVFQDRVLVQIDPVRAREARVQQQETPRP